MPGKTRLILDNITAGDTILTQIPTENTLYHYTSLGPFTEIVRSRAIWASNISNLPSALLGRFLSFTSTSTASRPSTTRSVITLVIVPSYAWRTHFVIRFVGPTSSLA